MTFQSRTIANVIPEINKNILLPAIQREFVWDDSQIIQLFDSITRGYPIGSLLFWNVHGEFAESQIKYKFIENYVTEPTYPPDLDDVQNHNKRVKNGIDDIPDKVTLVLDGQQRLTSIYLGLRGTYTDRKPRTLKSLEKNYRRKLLFLNLFNDPEKIDENPVNLKYHYSFRQYPPSNTENNYWFKVKDILSYENKYTGKDEIINEVKNDIGESNFTDTHRRCVEQNFSALYDAIYERDVLTYFEETTEDDERALEIFIRSNKGGTELAEEDLFLSMLTGQWSDILYECDKEIVARDEIYKFIDKLNNRDIIGSSQFESKFILKTLMLANTNDNSLSYSIFSNEELMRNMKKTWQNKKYKKSINNTLDLLDEFNISLTDTGTTSPLLTIFAYLYLNDNPNINKNSKDGNKRRKQLLYWLCSSIINGVYRVSTPQAIKSTVKVIRESAKNSKEFPIKEINKKLITYSSDLSFEKDYLKERIDSRNQNRRGTKLILGLMYYPDTATNSNLEVDHIFPKSILRTENLVDEYDMSLSKAKEINKLTDNIGNLQLLSESLNKSKQDEEFREWCEKMTDKYKENHLIPKNSDLYSMEKFPEFVEKRQDMIINHLHKNYNIENI